MRAANLASALAVATLFIYCSPEQSRRDDEEKSKPETANADVAASTTIEPDPGSQWVERKTESLIDDTPIITLFLPADSDITAWPRETIRLMLAIRCQEDETEVFIITRAAPRREPGTDNATVTIRLDKDEARDVAVSKSTDDRAIFFPRPIQFIKEMFDRDSMVFRFTPRRSSPQTTTFDISGLTTRIDTLRQACNW